MQSRNVPIFTKKKKKKSNEDSEIKGGNLLTITTRYSRIPGRYLELFGANPI